MLSEQNVIVAESASHVDWRSDGNRSGSTGACYRSGRVGSTLGNRCVIGRLHKMQSGTCTVFQMD